MEIKEFIKQRKQLKKELELAKDAIDKKYTKIHDDFIEANTEVKKLSVYELVRNGIKRHGFKRFVIYDRSVSTFDNHAMIQVGGWWLNSENVPTKWDSFTVFGVSNNAVFVLSENQIHLPHPDA